MHTPQLRSIKIIVKKYILHTKDMALQRKKFRYKLNTTTGPIGV